jgi:anti-sigma factor RsiW/mono/diheme cytochrome c family protein
MFGHVTSRLSAYCNGELPAAEARAVEAHVVQCARCREELEEIRLGVALASHLEPVPAPETLWQRVEAELDRTEGAPKTVPRWAWLDWRAAGAVAAVLLLGVWLAARWMSSEPAQPQPPPIAGPSPQAVAPVSYDLGAYLRPVQAASEAVSFQRVASAPPGFVERKRDESFSLQWLNRAINGPNQPLPGYALQSARSGAADGAPIVQLVYAKGKDKAFSVFIAPRRVEFKFGKEYAYEAEVGGIACRRVDCPMQRTFEFGEGGFKCVLVTKWIADEDAARVMRFFLEAYRDKGAQDLLPGAPKAAGLVLQPASYKMAVASEGDAQEDEESRLLKIGKKVFVAKCDSCHDADGSKALASGPPLNQRALTDEVIAKNVAPRLRTATNEEKRAVAAYIRSFLKSPAN